MKNAFVVFLLVLISLASPIVAAEARPTGPPYQGPPGGYSSPRTPDYIPPGMPVLFPIKPPQGWYRPHEPRWIPENPRPYRTNNTLPVDPNHLGEKTGGGSDR